MEVSIPQSAGELAAIQRRCRTLANKRALMSAGAGFVPLPGLDIAADIGILLKLIPEINREFGLTPEQIARLDTGRRVLVYKSIVAIGGALVGRVITQDLVRRALQAVGARIVAKQAAKYVPLAGQVLAAGLGYAAMRYVAEQHIKDCSRVARALIDVGPPVTWRESS